MNLPQLASPPWLITVTSLQEISLIPDLSAIIQFKARNPRATWSRFRGDFKASDVSSATLVDHKSTWGDVLQSCSAVTPINNAQHPSSGCLTKDELSECFEKSGNSSFLLPEDRA
ncbi:hypothetical protein [Synechococcus sp. MIT S1220]|uniref:hypothetical protein n=1 Tax=Synechococcus sp. MIT S1220 TaxID=3082549 RepID=UPI0039AF5141